MKFPRPKGTQLGWVKDRTLELTSDIKGWKDLPYGTLWKVLQKYLPLRQYFMSPGPREKEGCIAFPTAEKKHFLCC